MRKFLLGALTVATAALIVIAAALPIAVPQLVKRIAEEKLAAFGFPATVTMRLGYRWHMGPEIGGSLSVALADGPWHVRADFGAGFGEWHARVKMDETSFSESDPTIGRLLADHPIEAISNLTFSGSVALDASVERTRAIPVPVWSAKARLRNVSVKLMANDRPYEINGLSVTPGASGIANQRTISPMFPRISSVSAAGFELTNVYASVRATETSLMINEAGAGLCGGKVNLYSVFLNPTNLNAGLTLFVDDVDAGKTLSHLNGFRGKASGRLHGKVKLFVREGGKAVRLSDAFLYSTPGEVGKLQMENPKTITDNLALAGLDDDFQGNVRNALSNLDYTVLKLNLKRRPDNQATLAVRLSGTATRGDLTVPVDLNVNINGELEQLINTGLGLSNFNKGKQQ